MNDRNWGGKRNGSGRKKGEIEYQTFSVVLPKEEVDLLKRLAKRENLTVSRFISKNLELKERVDFEKLYNIKLYKEV